MEPEIKSRDLFLEYTPVRDASKAFIRCHRVWDAAKFIQSQQTAHTDPKIKPEDRMVVSVSNEEAYRAANWKKR